MQKTVVLFGAGKSATALISYLINEASANNWRVIIADADKNLILAKTNNSSFAEAIEMNVRSNEHRAAVIKRADIVISLMPPSLHFLIARDCVAFGKNLLTASYIDQPIKSLEPEIERKGLLFLCEMGLDPGIDHMSAMQMIDSIHAKGGSVVSFKSHCGGLIAPESDNNPWHYKISWNPKNVVMAGKAGAVYKTDGLIVKENYEELFDAKRGVEVSGLGFLSYYPNRDSIGYIDLYHLQEAKTFMRTTLRYPDFMYGWKNIIDLKLTDEIKEYKTDGLLLSDFFKQHLTENGLEDWLQKNIKEHFSQTTELLECLMKLMEAEDETKQEAEERNEPGLVVDEDGALTTTGPDEIKETTTAENIAEEMHKANITLKQLFYLGMDDDKTMINKGVCNTADVLQFILETKLALTTDDKDMVIMLHELSVQEQDKIYNLQSSMIVKGDDAANTAMAKTVGLPLGIATKLILNNTINLRGLQIPVMREIYEPVLEELKKYGIEFTTTW